MSRLTIYATAACISLSMVFAVESIGQRKLLKDIPIDIDLQERMTLQEVIDKVENSGKFTFVYSKRDIKGITIEFTNPVVSMEQLLNEISIQARVSIKRVNETISFKNVVLEATMPQLFEEIPVQQSISGKVTDENGEPLPGATVQEKGTNNGTITDVGGNYSLSVPQDAIMTVSFVGFQTLEVPLNGRTEISIQLQADISSLEEVVVIGYGTVRKSDLTGSVTSLSSDDLNDNVAVNVTQRLQGRAAGVQVFQNSNQPGGAATVQIRGIGSINAGNLPLYVVDGLPISNDGALSGADRVGVDNVPALPPNPLNSINPNDIESIEVLKDASATAIYGSRGANGVILITTKTGSRGKLKVNYSGKTSVFNIIALHDILTAQEYQTSLNALIDAGAVGATESERVTEIIDGGTDWQDEIFKNALAQEHTLSFSGGNEKNTYFTSLNYFNQEGVARGSNLERFALRTNLTTESDKFKLGVNIAASYSLEDIVSANTGGNNNSSVFAAATFYDPTAPIFENEATNEYYISPFLNIENPLAILNGRSINGTNLRILNTVYGEYAITPALKAKLNVGFDYQTARRDIFENDFTQAGASLGGFGQIYTGNNYNYLTEATISYSKNFGSQHRLNLLGGVTAQEFFITTSNSSAQDFLSLSTGTDNLQSGNPNLNTVSSSRVSNALLSYIGRVNYSFADKYLITGTMRVDGSSRFGENNKYGYFPSMAVAWKLSNEEFLKTSDVFEELKFRVSYGQTGNQDIGNFNSLTSIRSGGQLVIPGGDIIVSAQPSRIANPDLKWETTTQFDVGFDWSILRGRISGTIDYYDKLTNDLLFNIPIPVQTGFSSVLRNIGEIKNSGFEFLIESYNIQREFKWNTSLNFSTLKNEVLNIGGADEIISGSNILRLGEVINSYYGYEILGVWQLDDDFTNAPTGVQPGDWKYNDINGDGAVTLDDRIILGNSTPSFNWGMTNTFQYKGISLTANVIGVHGTQLVNALLSNTYFPTNFRRNRLAEPVLNRWTPENPTNEYPSFLNNTGQGTTFNSSVLEDAGYVRLQSVRLGYNIPLKAESFLNMLNVSIIGENLYTWTKYSGIDPGLSIVDGSNGRRSDYAAYPLSRIFSLNLMAEF